MAIGQAQRGLENGKGQRLARALGWFSHGLGLAQLIAPSDVARLIGIKDDDDNRALLRAIGVREIVPGLGILVRPRPVGWLWARLAGDAMDLALLGSALTSKNVRRDRVAAATAAVVGVTALDVFCATRLRSGRGAAEETAPQDDTRGVEKAITVNRPPEEVYALWRDFENLPRFMLHLESVEVMGDGRSHWKAKAPAGRTVEWDAEIVDDRPNELIAWRSLEGSGVQNSGSVRFNPAPGGRGTEVRVKLQYDPPAGAVGVTVAKLFGEEPNQQLREDVFRFKQVLETGEVVRSEGSLDGARLRQRPAQPPENAIVP
ncbi:MAG: SRPBCC family protein [Chloroflexota bacterium]|nr:SRPBCC family protein [Chloroflexota bacterium]